MNIHNFGPYILTGCPHSPEQLKEKWFVEVEGWTYKLPTKEEIQTGRRARWVNAKGEQMIPSTGGLPPLHESLDLHEQWVWPELRKRGNYKVSFNSTGVGGVNCL